MSGILHIAFVTACVAVFGGLAFGLFIWIARRATSILLLILICCGIVILLILAACAAVFEFGCDLAYRLGRRAA